jgi:hypothetical protein
MWSRAVRDHAQGGAAFDVEQTLEMDLHAAKQQQKAVCSSRSIVNCDAKYP